MAAAHAGARDKQHSSKVMSTRYNSSTRKGQRAARDMYVLPADKMKDRLTEVTREMQAESASSRGRLQMETFLAKEIESHTCPICYELMLAPSKTPTLLFPCGHTFCCECLDIASRGSKLSQRCPYCREPVERKAANLSLQQLIQSYAAQKNAITMKQEVEPLADDTHPPAAQISASTEEDR
jgi:hypothetical protein